MPEPLKIEVPAIAVFGKDRIVHIPEVGDEPARDVDWTVVRREERMCVEHGRRHLDVAYTEPAEAEGDPTEGGHTFDDPANTWVRVERPVVAVLSEGAAA